jgi:peptidoglycan/xylan/chitin deacetylase (PgdA/CDA1 family)
MQRIHDEGHAIGVHSYSHVYSEIYESVEAFLEDFNKARELIYEQIGIRPDIYRFPGGSKNTHNEDIRDDVIAEMTRRGFVYFDWNIDSDDTRGASYDRMLREIPREIGELSMAGERSIVLFHDSGSHTSWVIDDLIDVLEASTVGYTFAVIDTNTQPMQW